MLIYILYIYIFIYIYIQTLSVFIIVCLPQVFSKAFDKVPHRRLSVKLSYYGINGSTLTWMNDFLSNRVHAVSFNGLYSTWDNVTSGVPQGSVIGPALFLIYINDIKEKIQSNMRLYADDAIVYRDINSVNGHSIFQDDLDTV